MNDDKHQQGGDIIKELIALHDWHLKTYKATARHKKKADHMKFVYLASAAREMIQRQDVIIATRDKTIARLRADLEKQISLLSPKHPSGHYNIQDGKVTYRHNPALDASLKARST